MLEPTDRSILIDLLRPDDGYKLDYMIGTTYSLDLAMLMTTSLAFCSFETEGPDGKPSSDPLLLFNVLQDASKSMTIFCQAGGIQARPGETRLYPLIENCVAEVATEEGVFHPKLWVLRMTGPEKSVRYRVLCLSRNLTQDTSWDTALSLEGELRNDREKGFAKNRPLSDFIEALPTLTKFDLSREQKSRIKKIAEELSRVEFELPDGIDDVNFQPIGIPNHNHPFTYNCNRMLIISPFLSEKALDEISNGTQDKVLISRLDSLQQLPAECLEPFREIYSFTGQQNEGAENATDLSGLHAKLFVQEQGWDSYVATGSANATNSALHRNVEFLVELIGKKSRVGIDQILGHGSGTEVSLKSLLQPFTPDKNGVQTDALERELENRLRLAEEAFVRISFECLVEPSSDDTFTLIYRPSKKIKAKPDAQVRVRPVTLKNTPILLPDDFSARFEGVSFGAITPYLVCELSVSSSGRTKTKELVITAPLINAPTNRADRSLTSLIENPSHLMNFLLMMLGQGITGDPLARALAEKTVAAKNGHSSSTSTLPLFELLVSALERGPHILDQMANTVNELLKLPDGEKYLPEGFNKIWLPIWEARERMRIC